MIQAQNPFVCHSCVTIYKLQSTDRFQAAYRLPRITQLGRKICTFSTLFKSELLLVKSESVIVMQLRKMKSNEDRFYVTIHAFDISMMIPFPDHTTLMGG